MQVEITEMNLCPVCNLTLLPSGGHMCLNSIPLHISQHFSFVKEEAMAV